MYVICLLLGDHAGLEMPCFALVICLGSPPSRGDVDAHPRLVGFAIGPRDYVCYLPPIRRYLRIANSTQQVKVFGMDSSLRGPRHHSLLVLTAPCLGAALIQEHRQPRQAPEARDPSPLERRLRESQRRKASYEGTHGDLRLGPGQRSTEAEMHAASERVMVRILSRYVEFVRLWVGRRIMVCRR